MVLPRFWDMCGRWCRTGCVTHTHDCVALRGVSRDLPPPIGCQKHNADTPKTARDSIAPTKQQKTIRAPSGSSRAKTFSIIYYIFERDRDAHFHATQRQKNAYLYPLEATVFDGNRDGKTRCRTSNGRARLDIGRFFFWFLVKFLWIYI